MYTIFIYTLLGIVQFQKIDEQVQDDNLKEKKPANLNKVRVDFQSGIDEYLN